MFVSPFSDGDKPGSCYSQYLYWFVQLVNLLLCNRLHLLRPPPLCHPLSHLPLPPASLTTCARFHLPLTAPFPQALTCWPWEGKVRGDGLKKMKGQVFFFILSLLLTPPTSLFTFRYLNCPRKLIPESLSRPSTSLCCCSCYRHSPGPTVSPLDHSCGLLTGLPMASLPHWHSPHRVHFLKSCLFSLLCWNFSTAFYHFS